MTEGSTAAGGGANTVGTSFLAAASGSADVITFLTLGHVFGSAMTGNTALLGIAYAAGALLAGLIEWSAFALLTWMACRRCGTGPDGVRGGAGADCGRLTPQVSHGTAWEIGDERNQQRSHTEVLPRRNRCQTRKSRRNFRRPAKRSATRTRSA